MHGRIMAMQKGIRQNHGRRNGEGIKQGNGGNGRILEGQNGKVIGVDIQNGHGQIGQGMSLERD